MICKVEVAQAHRLAFLSLLTWFYDQGEIGQEEQLPEKHVTLEASNEHEDDPQPD
jgi:hypothetical protein